jgi:prevent-host-death family protein
MPVINTHQAKTQLSRLIDQAMLGEEVIIARAGKPVARLVPYEVNVQARNGGQWRGKVRMAPDFDQLPEDLAAAFRGERP